MKKGKNQSEKDKSELFVVSGASLPPPLDNHIASVIVTTRSNYLNDGYDIDLTATFGEEWITLSADETRIEVLFSLNKAEIKLDFINSDFFYMLTGDKDGDTEWKHTEISHEESSKAKKGGLSGRVSAKLDSVTSLVPSADGYAQVQYELANSSKSTTTSSRTRRNWKPIATDAISVGDGERQLNGTEILVHSGWRVFPAPDSDSGVVATLKAREAWINFRKVRQSDPSGSLGQKIRRLFESKDETRKYCFTLLLRHLATHQLKNLQSENVATLSASAIVVRPAHDQMHSVKSNDSNTTLNIDAEILGEFFSTKTGDETAFLQKSGVPNGILQKSPSTRPPKQSLLEKFVPQSSPANMTMVLGEIVGHKKSEGLGSRAQLEKRYGRNVTRDLFTLGILESLGRDGNCTVARGTYADPALTIKHLASKSPAIQASIEAIQMDQNVTARDLADFVAEKMDKDWGLKSTKQRHGGALRRWAIWVAPHIVDPEQNPSAYALIERATSYPAMRKGPRKLTSTLRSRIVDRRMTGSTIQEISNELGISATTIRRALPKGSKLSKEQLQESRKRNNTQRKPGGGRIGLLTHLQKSEIKALFQSGMTVMEIHRKVDIPYHLIRYFLVRRKK